LPSLQPSITVPENGDFDLDTYLQSFDASEVLVDDRRFFIYNFGRDAAEDKSAENGDFEREAAEDEASEDEVHGATIYQVHLLTSTTRSFLLLFMS
jgi:hypothetical protein